MNSPKFNLPHFSLTGPLGISLLSLALALLVVLNAAFALMSSAFGSGAGSVKPDEEVVKLVDEHKDRMETWQERFNGRSIFFKPKPKQVYVPPPPPPPKDEAPPPPPPPTAPANYTGPSVKWLFGSEVYFAAPNVNEPPFSILSGEEKHGIKVLSVDAPWSVKLAYKGGEYELKLWSTGNIATKLTANPPPNVILKGIIHVDEPGAAAAMAAAAAAANTASSATNGDEGGDDEGETATMNNGDDEPDDEGDEPPASARSRSSSNMTPAEARKQRLRNAERQREAEKPVEVPKTPETTDPNPPEPSPPSL